MTLMQQYHEAKARHPNMLLLFRVGDFYELFGDDAETASKVLGLTLTTRDKTVLMAGFPHHALEMYLSHLLKAGQRVAICDQVVESPCSTRPVRVVVPERDSQPTLFDEVA
jgi:DNA mismatch repair protein MutS